jgi:chromosome segregation ATPase
VKAKIKKILILEMMEINNNEINDALKNMWEVAKKATEKIANSNKKVNELQAQFDFLEKTINQKNKKNEELSNKIKELEKNINEKNERITSQYAEIDTLIKQQEKYSELETSYFTTVNENQNLKNELENFINQKQELEKIYDEYKNISEKFLKIETENHQLKNKLATVEKEIRDYEITKKELLNHRHEIIGRNEQIDKIKIQLAESQSIVFNQNVKIKELEKQNKFLNENNENLNEKNQEQMQKNSSFDEKINQIIAENNIEKMNLIAKNSALQNELKDFYHSKLHLENSFNEGKKSFSEEINSFVEGKNEEINNIIIEKNEEINGIINEKNNIVEKYQNAIQQYEKDIEKLQKINHSLNEKNEELHQKIILSDENDFVNQGKDATELNNENERLLDIVAELSGELNKMQNEYKNTFGENTKLANDNKNLQDELQKIQKLTAAFENIKKTNDEQTGTIAKLKTELKYYKKRVYDDESLFASENINLLGEVEIKYKQQIDDLNLEISRINSDNIFLTNKLKEKETAHQIEIKNQQQLEKDVTVATVETVENDFDKNELVNKLESFITKLSKKLDG